MDQAIVVEVPLHFLNAEDCVGVRQGGGNVSHNMTSVEINCLPGDLPEFIEVDILNLNIGDSIHMSELVLAKDLTIPSLQQGADHDHVVVSVYEPKRIEEVEEVLEEDAEAVDEAGEAAADSGEEESSEDE